LIAVGESAAVEAAAVEVVVHEDPHVVHEKAVVMA